MQDAQSVHVYLGSFRLNDVKEKGRKIISVSSNAIDKHPNFNIKPTLKWVSFSIFLK